MRHMFEECLTDCDSRHKMTASVANCPIARFVQSIFTLKSANRSEQIISCRTMRALEKGIKPIRQICTFGQVMPDFFTFGHFMAFLAACGALLCSSTALLGGQDMPFLRPIYAVSHIDLMKLSSEEMRTYCLLKRSETSTTRRSRSK